MFSQLEYTIFLSEGSAGRADPMSDILNSGNVQDGIHKSTLYKKH